MRVGRVHVAEPGPAGLLRVALAGLLLAGATVSTQVWAADGISCPSGVAEPRGQEGPNVESARVSPQRPGDSRVFPAPIDAARPARTEVATFALG